MGREQTQGARGGKGEDLGSAHSGTFSSLLLWMGSGQLPPGASFAFTPPMVVSLFLLYWPSANGMGADLPFLGRHCNYEAAQWRGWRCLARCEGGRCALQCSLGSSQLIFHCCYTAENGLESIFLPAFYLLSSPPRCLFLMLKCSFVSL